MERSQNPALKFAVCLAASCLLSLALVVTLLFPPRSEYLETWDMSHGRHVLSREILPSHSNPWSSLVHTSLRPRWADEPIMGGGPMTRYWIRGTCVNYAHFAAEFVILFPLLLLSIPLTLRTKRALTSNAPAFEVLPAPPA